MKHVWYCTCKTESKIGKSIQHRHMKFHVTEANYEGICNNCGHYSIAISDYEIYPRQGHGTNSGYRPVSKMQDNWYKKGWNTTMLNRYFNQERGDYIGYKRVDTIDSLEKHKDSQ